MKLYLLALSIMACHSVAKLPLSPSPKTPLASRALLSNTSSDTVLNEQTARWNTKNPVAEITIFTIRVKNVIVGTCIFGLISDSSLVSFPSNGVDCGYYYQAWVARRQSQSSH